MKKKKDKSSWQKRLLEKIKRDKHCFEDVKEVKKDDFKKILKKL